MVKRFRLVVRKDSKEFGVLGKILKGIINNMLAAQQSSTTFIFIVKAFAAVLFTLTGCATHDTIKSSPSSGTKSSTPLCAEYAISLDASINGPKVLTHQLPKMPSSGPLPAYACLHVTVNEAGRVADGIVVKTNNEEFANSALASMDGWTFEPATQNGKPISVRKLFSSGAE